MSVICVGIVSFNTGSRLTYLSFQSDKAGRIMTEIEEHPRFVLSQEGGGGSKYFLS